MKNRALQNLWDAEKAVLRGKLTAFNASIRKEDISDNES